MDIPALTYGIDIGGAGPTPFERAQTLAAEAWGARRAWFLINGASQGNLVAGLALAHAGGGGVVERHTPPGTIGAPTFSGPRAALLAPGGHPPPQKPPPLPPAPPG